MYFGAQLESNLSRMEQSEQIAKLLSQGYTRVMPVGIDMVDAASEEGVAVESVYLPKWNAAQLKALAGQFPNVEFIVDCTDGAARELASLAGVKAALRCGSEADEQAARSCGIAIQADVRALAASNVDVEAFLWRNEAAVTSILYGDVRDDDVTYSCFQFARAHGTAQIISAGNRMLQARELLQSWGHRRDGSVSTLNIMDTETGEIRQLRSYDKVIEAPNWLKDGDTLLYNSQGHIFRYSIEKDAEEMIDTGMCDNCNNDHVPSPDGTMLAVSHNLRDTGISMIFTLPITGGTPTQVTPVGHSYLHGWSVDGKLAYCAMRGIPGKADIGVISANGGQETLIAGSTALNDGPEFSPDGKQIWFNSTRTGMMQVFRMNADGTDPVQLTDNDNNNWFPHISPDNRKVVYVSYRKGDLEPWEHLPNMQVSLWKMNPDGTGKHKLLDLFGGQGSINVNSWAPDSRRIAFVTYEVKHR